MHCLPVRLTKDLPLILPSGDVSLITYCVQALVTHAGRDLHKEPLVTLPVLRLSRTLGIFEAPQHLGFK